jgi:hypothetical protein
MLGHETTFWMLAESERALWMAKNELTIMDQQQCEEYNLYPALV